MAVSSLFTFKAVRFRNELKTQGDRHGIENRRGPRTWSVVRRVTVSMNELLNSAVNAHGGLERWNKVTSVKVAASITGAIWFVKGQGNALKDIVMTVDTKDERLVTDFPGQDKRSIFEPNRVVMEKVDGTVIESRDNPEESFKG